MNLSKEECYQCIAECMIESLPNNWKTAWMDAEIEGNEINVSYSYKAGLFNKTSKFKTSNVFAPMNAIKALQQMMSSEGNRWAKAQFAIKNDGTFELKIIA